MVIDDVSDTARWVAYLRALESERADALFHDFYARELAGERGREIAEAMPLLPWLRKDGMSVSLGVRTRVFDELLLAHLHGADAVLNLAAGLDMRPFRLSLPTDLTWYEADCAALLQRKAQFVDPRVQRIAVDLADTQARHALFERVAKHRHVVVISEGLLVYLPTAVVGELARELSFAKRWLVEMVHPKQLALHMKHWGPTLGNARWQFASDEGLAYFNAFGWSVLEERPFYTESRRLERSGLRHPSVVHALSRIMPRVREELARAVVYGVLKWTVG